MENNVKINIEIDNLTKAQAIAIEDMMAVWVNLGSNGSSRWTSFMADGDGNFRPKITIDGKNPKRTNLVPEEYFWVKDEYRVDFDAIAWGLSEEGDK
jgi:hypothetical protein